MPECTSSSGCDAAPKAGALSIRAVLAGALCDPGALWRVFLSFALWFAVSPVPWINIGATLGLFGVVADIAHDRPVSPIDVLSARNREKAIPGLFTLGTALAALAGAAAVGFAAAFHAGLFFALFPGWTVGGAALPCPCLAATPFQRFAALAICACGFVPALALASAWSLALPVFMDGGESGLCALKRSARLVKGNLAPVMALTLLMAVAAMAVALAALRCGASVAAVFAGEAVVATLAIRVAGRTYGALLASDGAAGCDRR
ncbi:MAG: hypothetical protein IJS46_02560 [Kiritimatiellae bacterium]|nr:hypothetical protein [Kiritimatiellia bacterium]